MSDQPASPAAEQPSALQRLRSKGIHSVFDVVREGRTAFAARMASDTSDAEAGTLYDLAMQRASGLTRLHTRLTVRDEPAAQALPKLASGGSRERMQGLSIGGSGDYENWFTRKGLFPAPDSVASLFSPASYLVDLYRVARTMHARSDHSHIDTRRPDLKLTSLSQAWMDNELPTVDLINEILADGIEVKFPGVKADSQLKTAVYPFGLPYDIRADEITEGLRALGTDEKRIHTLLGGLDHGSFLPDEDLAAAHEADYTAEVVRARIGLSPGEYTLLTTDEPPAETIAAWGGVEIPITTSKELLEQSGLSVDQLHSLLRTPTVTGLNGLVVQPDSYGAQYINDGGVPLKLAVSAEDEGYGELKDARAAHFPQLHRMIRLKARIPLTYEQIDNLWAGAFHAGGVKDMTHAARAIATYLTLSEQTALPFETFEAITGWINVYAHDGETSFLRKVFHKGIEADIEKDIDFGTTASFDSETTPGRLAQGLGIDAATLRKLAALVADKAPGDTVLITQTVSFWSALYRIVEIPRLAGLTVDEGLLLWSCMESEPGKILASLTTSGSAVLCAGAQRVLQRTLETTAWLRARSIDIPTLAAIVTREHREVATAEILQFVANIHSSVSGDATRFGGTATSNDLIRDQLGRHVGAQFGLTAGVARAMIFWLDKVIVEMDGGLNDYSSEKFWSEIVQLFKQSTRVSLEAVSGSIVKYCHLLGQFALVCHVTNLQEQDISLIIAPENGSLLCSETPPPLSLQTLFWLFTYTAWRDTLPGSAAEARLHIGATVPGDDEALKIKDFGALNGWDPDMTSAIFSLLNYPRLEDMRHVHQLARWMKVATDLQLSPDKVAIMKNLLALQDPDSSEAKRESISPAILGAVRARLSDSKASDLAHRLSENRRDGLLRFYIQNCLPNTIAPKVKTPDDLYEYMLIDAQVSAKVTTSRIAEAISSVQLYLHRCREGLEDEIIPEALAEALKPGGYFSLWDAYNKRYGSWAGLQRLLRYPASYIDPTLRYVKSAPFRALEDELNQGRLTAQRADQAFHAFVEAIRGVLDIECIDGYQLGDTLDDPAVFLGRNHESPARYFWRRAAPKTSEDVFAWSDWLPVDADVPTYAGEYEIPSIVYFAGAVRVAWWHWKTDTVSASGTLAKPSPLDVTLVPKYKLEVHIATLGKSGTWRSQSFPIAYTDGDFGRLQLRTYGEGQSERLLYVAPKDATWSSTGILRSFDRTLDPGDGPAGAFNFSPTTVGRPLRGQARFASGKWTDSIKRYGISRFAGVRYPMLNYDLTNKHWLSSLAGPVFEERLGLGIDSLLSYTTQTTPVEYDSDGSIDSPIRWIGGTGGYMWDLFFHAPFLIACRLLDEQRFDEAEVWLRRIFSPSGYVGADGRLQTDTDGNVRYWNVVPLQEDTVWNEGSGPADTDDPDAVAMSDPMHYKLAVYLRWLQLYLDRGDMAYRQQTRDSMTEAKMWYVQASQLLGRRPHFHGLLPGVWNDPKLTDAADTINRALDALEALVGDSEMTLPTTQLGQIRIVDGVFLPPVDEGTLVWWDRFAQRLYNLRNGLSLDGQPLHLPLYETPVSPRELQQRRLAADAGAGGLDPASVAMPAFRFVVLLDRARAAVQQLMQFGSTLQGILERRDYDALNVLQQVQTVQVHELTAQAHAFQMTMIEHTATGLLVSRSQAGDRERHYAFLANQFMNTAEIASMGMRTAAPLLLHGSIGATVTSAALDMVPNTWVAGMAAGVGGTMWSAVARAVAEGLTTEANALEMTAGTLDMIAGFQRRREEWQLQSRQAALEIMQLDSQIAANTAAHDQVLKQATQMEIEHGYAQAVLDTLTTRFTGKDLFNWQAGRVSTLYYQLYDATLSLCTWAQKAYRFETGDGTTFLQPGAWDDRYQGLLAGESLALGLQRLDRAHLAWDQRALEVERTLSLSALAGEPLGDTIAEVLDGASHKAVGDVTVTYEEEVLNVSFDLAKAHIADDYPATMGFGATRRIKSIAVTLPALLGPYEDIRASLVFSGSTAAELPSGCSMIALSRGLSDTGQFVLDFNDGKYLPFEGIPVDDAGKFTLRFPNSGPRNQADMLLSITDVIMHIRYTIRADKAA